MLPLFQKYLSPQVRTNKLVNSVVCHPCPSRLALEFYLSPECLPSVGKNFQFMVFILENALNLRIFTHTLVPNTKLQKRTKHGGLRIWNFQGYQRNKLWNFQGLIIKVIIKVTLKKISFCLKPSKSEVVTLL